jgi:hypothetical protein
MKMAYLFMSSLWKYYASVKGDITTAVLGDGDGDGDGIRCCILALAIDKIIRHRCNHSLPGLLQLSPAGSLANGCPPTTLCCVSVAATPTVMKAVVD